jgi:hypothetical protein
MTTLNGDSNFPQTDLATSSTAPGKRKRSESADVFSSNNTLGATKQVSGFSRKLQNALPLLRKYVNVQILVPFQLIMHLRADQVPSLLNFALALSGERSPKRARYSSEHAEIECISTRIEAGVYHSPDSLLADVDTAADSLIESLQSREHALNDSDSASRAINQVNLFKQALSRVCGHIVEADAEVQEENGVDEDSLPGGAEDIQRPAVLTLTSQTDKGPKHLYSGLQRTKKDSLVDSNVSNTGQPRELPKLDAGSFPNGITFTQVPPSNAPDQPSSAKQKRTFSEVFRPHRSLKALEPPRPSRNATRGSSLGWVNHEELSGPERPTPTYKSDYRYASIPTGSWLHYNSADELNARATESKRRQRDRALSFGESRAEPAEDLAEHEQARTKALFQSAYSSFAPTIDNSAAVVPEKTRSQAWWNTVGQKRFHALLALQYPESDLNGSDSALDTIGSGEDDFEGVVADFEEETLGHPLQDHSKEADSKEVEELLQEISDLLQTLSSYQRIRNLSKMNSGPATPTSAETGIYEGLRSSLSILVNSLPPYAVAKLSGDQLEMLNVSTNIVVDLKDHVGTMELDEYSLQRQRVALAATHPAAGRPSVSVGTAGRPGNYNAQSVNYNQRPNYSNVPRTPYTNQSRPIPANTNPGTPQPSNYPGARPAAMSSQRPGLPAQQQYPNQTYSQGPTAAQFQRPSSTQQNGYTPSYIQNVNSQAYVQQRQSQPSYSYPLNQSPQKPVQSPQTVVHAQQQYSQQQPSQQIQASLSNPYPINNQVAMTEQARIQLQAQRQLSGTPQTQHINGQYAQMARSSTPGGGAPNGRPAVAAIGGGQ